LLAVNIFLMYTSVTGYYVYFLPERMYLATLPCSETILEIVKTGIISTLLLKVLLEIEKPAPKNRSNIKI
jgi:hypothetical protein